MHYSVIWIPIFFFQSIDSQFNCGKKRVVNFSYFLGIIFTILNFLGFLIGPSRPKLGFAFFMEPGSAYELFLLFFFSLLGYSYYLLFSAYKSSTGFTKNQIKIILGSTIIGHVGGITNFLPVYDIWLFPLNPFFTCLIIVYVAGIVYAILTFKLFDFNLLMRWGLAYFILIASIGMVAAPVIILSEWLTKRYLNIPTGIFTLAVVGCVVFIFDPLRKRVTKFVDQIIFRSPDFQAILVGLQDAIKDSTSLDDLSRKLIEKLKSIWKVDHAGVVLWDYRSASFKLLPPEEFQNQIINRMNETIRPTDYLVRTLETERRLFWQGVVVEEELIALMGRAMPGEKTTFSKIRRSMRWLGAVVCVPLMTEDRLAGFIILGPKKNEALYNDEDKKFLSHVVNLVAFPIKILNSHLSDQGKQFS